MSSPLNTYIIAEVGQNHNGRMDYARQLIDVAGMLIFDKFDNRQMAGINAVKFTKRDLSEELTTEAYDEPYDSPHAFGNTYGSHREKLELSYEQHAELYHYAKSKGLDFVETLTSIKTLKLLDKIEPDAIKVASRDLTNLPLLSEIAQAKRRVILSTGMSGLQEIDEAVNEITKYHENLAILHCVSQYPAAYDNVNLLSVQFLQERYPSFDIGFSDHTIGIVVAPVAVALGARLIEKHVTLNHNMKGSDHRGSLEPEGLWRMVRDIRNVEVSLGDKKKDVPAEVAATRDKLERSIAAKRDLNAGEILAEGDLCLLSPGTGLRWRDRAQIVGKKIKRALAQHSHILPEYLDDA